MTATKKTYVEWVEPFDEDAKFTQIVRVPVEQVIEYQMSRVNYPTEKQALDDFIYAHYGYLKVYEV